MTARDRKGEHRGMAVVIRNAGITVAASLLLAGCVSLGSKVPDQLITLTSDARAPAGEVRSGAPSESIVVLDPDTDRRLDVTRVPVQVDSSTIAYLKKAVWVEKPARQFRRLLAETIRAQSGRVVVEGKDYEVAGSTVVSGSLVDMGYDAQLQAVVVRYDAVVEDGEGKINARRFEAEVPVASPKPKHVAPALNEAANTVAAEVAEWLEPTDTPETDDAGGD